MYTTFFQEPFIQLFKLVIPQHLHAMASCRTNTDSVNKTGVVENILKYIVLVC